MYKIVYLDTVQKVLKNYSNRYELYFEELFADSGIWSEESIIENYFNESQKRYNEILDSIEGKLSNTLISYSNNQAIIRWRSKILLVSFRDETDTRIITDLEIR